MEGVHVHGDWRKVSQAAVIDAVGLIFGKKQRFSNLLELLSLKYPQLQWVQGHTHRIPPALWKNSEHLKGVVSKLQEEYTLQHKNDWYRLSVEQLTESFGRRFGMSKLIGSVGSVFPEEEWKGTVFARRTKKSRQRSLLGVLRGLLPGDVIIEEYRSPQIKRRTGFWLELDLYVPRLKVAFEFQGQQHYQSIPGFSDLEGRRNRDAEKKELCEINNILLVSIPYWWDNTLQGLRPFLPQSFPDLKI
eukprot:TRINITY_DN1928_c0_g1_i1.p1 TRINITY_DN1928_c0_g1~~TRINITY_DN1928_c0_g1_i1.p1  ORF type:complete len:246 (+),score=59.57 TRINITY_DN1928_c0_g1_i1:561-1298(+)